MKKQGRGVRGMGHIFRPAYYDKSTGEKKTSAIWWIKYSVRGKTERESSHSTSHADAVRLLKRRIGEVQAGRAVGNVVERTTLNDLIGMITDDYLTNGNRSLVRLKGACVHLRAHLDGARKANTITSDVVTKYAVTRLEEGAAKASVNMEQAFLARAFRLAAKAGKVNARPEMSMLKLDNTRKGFCELGQFRAVLKHLPEHAQAIAVIGYYSGWRRNELATRLWKHLDMESGTLRLEPGETKNREARSFPLFQIPELRAVIEAQQVRKRELEKSTGQIINHIFFSPTGGFLDFRRAWRTACRAAGVPKLLFHDLRRTAVRNMERAGVPRSTSMKLSGHQTEAVFRRYAITDSKMLEEGVAKLAVMAEMSQDIGQGTVKVTSISVKKR